MNTRMPGRSYGRLGWLLTTLALAVALILSAWINYRGAEEAASAVTRGQAGLFEAALRLVIPPFDDQAVAQDSLDAFLAAQEAAGVRYVALFNPDSSILAQAGQTMNVAASMPPDTMRGPSQFIMMAGERVRVYFVRPLPRPRSFGPDDRMGAPPMPGPPGERGRRSERGERPRVLHYALIEFVPVQARALVARAERSLILATVSANILGLAALLFWRISGRYNKARLQLEEQRRLSQLGEMSAVLAHEIRNPLASLKGHAQLLAEKLPADSREKARADRVVAEATRLEGLTTDLLDFARSGPVELRASDPLEILRTSIADVAEDGFTLDTENAPASWALDAARVRHALVNVLQNARQASPVNQPPAVHVAEEGGRLIYEVRDFGAGLPKGGEDRIFDPFYTTRTNGTGLGLAVTRRVIELHGGRISARNHPEGGAVFRIELP